MASVTLTNVTKSFGETHVIKGVSLDVTDGEFAVFVGPSGCGKSTLLRMIAGLEATTSGTIAIGGHDHTHSAPSARDVAMVFQSYALYPHMTVEDNLTFGMRMRGVDKTTISQKLRRAVDILRLGDYLARKPGELSGGQCQRVAIGRALVQEPQVFLFDEPLSNLDAELRLAMRVEIQALHRELGTTMIYVTHDQVEAMTLAHKIVVLRGGNVEQVGAPLDLYHRPGNTFVAGFIGSPAMNLLPLGALDLVAPSASKTLGVRPEHFAIAATGTALRISNIESLGATTYLYGALPSGDRVCVEARSVGALALGDTLCITPAADRVHWFDGEGKRVE